MATRCKNPLPPPRKSGVLILTNLEKLQAVDRSQRTSPPVLVCRLYQLEAFDKFMKKVLDQKGGSW